MTGLIPSVPDGQLNQIAQEIAVREGKSLQETASLFAALNTALADVNRRLEREIH
ncbi:MAG UNVERIFIED_CONTAM: hypothetical protein LVR29_09000 [Microcystis novacekii LVE1205-3]